LVVVYSVFKGFRVFEIPVWEYALGHDLSGCYVDRWKPVTRTTNPGTYLRALLTLSHSISQLWRLYVVACIPGLRLLIGIGYDWRKGTAHNKGASVVGGRRAYIQMSNQKA